MNMCDPSGCWPIKNMIKFAAENVIMPGVNLAEDVLSNVDATYSEGVCFSFSPTIFSFNLQGGMSFDTKGNIAIQGTFSGGFTGGSSSWAFTRYSSVTNAPNINKLEGPGCNIGGSAGRSVYGVPLVAGKDYNIIPDEELKKTYFGITNNVGFGAPGIEGHVEWGETATWKASQINVFDVAEEIYQRIMEW